MKNARMVWVGVGCCLLMGCGPSSQSGAVSDGKSSAPAADAGTTPRAARSTSPTVTGTNSQPTEHPLVQIAPNLPPDEIVRLFLDALRNGDENMATALLTTRARDEIAKTEGLAIQTPGRPTTKYAVGQVHLQNDTAQVATTFSDQDERGETINVAVPWLLRQQNGQWRVSGMYAPVGGKMLLLDFEHPEEMVGKVEAEQARMAAQRSTNGQPPTPPALGVQR